MWKHRSFSQYRDYHAKIMRMTPFLSFLWHLPGEKLPRILLNLWKGISTVFSDHIGWPSDVRHVLSDGSHVMYGLFGGDLHSGIILQLSSRYFVLQKYQEKMFTLWPY